MITISDCNQPIDATAIFSKNGRYSFEDAGAITATTVHLGFPNDEVQERVQYTSRTFNEK